MTPTDFAPIAGDSSPSRALLTRLFVTATSGRMKSLVRLVFATVLVLSNARFAHATTVIEKNLDALCAEADQVFVGTVISVQSAWTEAQHRDIETTVTFGDLVALLGVDTTEVSLQFSGGRVGDVIEYVPGMPQFNVGERFVIFARGGGSASALVGFHQGFFRVDGNGTSETVAVRSYERIGTLADGRSVIGDSASATTNVPLEDFLNDVRRRLAQRQGAQP